MSASTTPAAANEASSVLASANAASTVSYGGSRSQFKMTSNGKNLDGSRKQTSSIDGAQKLVCSLIRHIRTPLVAYKHRKSQLSAFSSFIHFELKLCIFLSQLFKLNPRTFLR